MSKEPAQQHAGPNNPATAFPLVDRTHTFPGMALRDWFAGQVASDLFYGQITKFPEDEASSVNDAAATVAKWSYCLADAMLAARAKAEGE